MNPAAYPGPMAPPATLDALLALLRADPGRPRVTWYDGDERVELSGAVLENWVTKTTNLLVEELDVGPGRTVLVDLPGHWRALVWWLATLRAGACLATTAGAVDRPDVVVTTDPDAWPAERELVVVTLAALARRAAGPLPAGAIDAAAAVMTYPDALGPVERPAPADPALRTVGSSAARAVVAHAALLGWARDAAAPADLAVGTAAVATADAPGARRRVLLAARGPVDTLVATCLSVLADDGSLVLCSAATAVALTADPDRLARLRGSERVTG